MMKIAILDDYLRQAIDCANWARLRGRAELTVFDRPLASVEEAASQLADFEILCTLRERMPIPRALIERLPRLKYIVVTGKRYDTVDVAAAAERGIMVSNTGSSGAGAGAVAELTWGLILSLARDIPFEDRMMRAGEWQHGAGTTLRGRRLGILGLGSLGQQVARVGAAFGMEVRAWSPNLTPERATTGGATWISKDELFATSDVVSLHLALGETTRGIVGACEIDLMRSTSFLVNTARAALLDEAALLEALRTRRIAGAGLDVYSVEPLPPKHPIRSLRNVVLTPHLGYFTRETLSAFYGDALDLIEAFLDGEPSRLVSSPIHA